jgi:hypothetical protein
MNDIKFSRFSEGSLPSHFPFAEFFLDFPALFQKNFLLARKSKKAPTASVFQVQ